VRSKEAVFIAATEVQRVQVVRIEEGNTYLSVVVITRREYEVMQRSTIVLGKMDIPNGLHRLLCKMQPNNGHLAVNQGEVAFRFCSVSPALAYSTSRSVLLVRIC